MVCCRWFTRAARITLLVVTGPTGGRVVYIDQDLGGSPYFVPDPDFLSWYERWLDELLWGFDGSWFGAGLPGREPDLVRVLTEGGEPGLQAEALTTLGRITALQPETLRALRPLLRGGSADVREQACRLLGKHQVSEAAAEINGLLEDPEPGVRKAALDALTRLPGEAGKAAARRLLGDVNESVVFRALRAEGCGCPESRRRRAAVQLAGPNRPAERPVGLGGDPERAGRRPRPRSLRP
ncbi:MAG: HEAT repeat domain-containing protein [Isosphaeraceae bacterium]